MRANNSYTYLGKCGSLFWSKICIDIYVTGGGGQDLDVKSTFRIEFSICE